METSVSSNGNSFPLTVCLFKNTPEVEDGEKIRVDNSEGIGAVCLVHFFLFLHPVPLCAAVIASSLMLPAAMERHAHTDT